MTLRFALLIIFPIAAYSFLLFRLYDIQVINGEQYLARAGSEYAELRFLKANRGVVYFSDKNGRLLPAVLNRDYPLIYAVPEAIEDPSEAANILGPVLDKPVEELMLVFSDKDDSYEVLAKKAGVDLVEEIGGLNIKGVYADFEPGRFYPLGLLASHVLGFVGPRSDDVGDTGRYGLEAYYENSLAGEAGQIVDGKTIKTTPGADLALTIDPNIQIESAKILKNLVDEHGAEGGSVIVMDPETGRILAMESLPGFDPGSYGKFPISSFLNPAIQKIYEPGSVFKVITMAAGIDSGKITPETTYYDKGSITLDGWTIKNFDLEKNGPYGRVSMTRVLERSINTGAVFAQREMGREIFADYARRFGFGEKTGVDLPGEIAGDLRRLSPKERDVVFATASYGQGIAVTPLGLVRAMAAIANGGKLVGPHLNAETEPLAARRVISENTAKLVAEMMVSAVDKAEVAAVKGYTIAGKTGTAFVPDFTHGGYTERVINTYVGFGPTTNPRFVALIKLDKPEGASLAAFTVVPAFRNLAQFILNYYAVEPDRL